MNKEKKKRGRPKGSKNKETKKKSNQKIVKKIEKETDKPKEKLVLKTIKPVKYKPKELKINDIYKKNSKFFLFGKYSGFISRWLPGYEKIPFDENQFTILEEFPTEVQYYNLMCGRKI